MNYFNTLPLRLQLEQLGKCRFMDQSEFSDGVNKLVGQKVVIVGCGAQGLNQGLNMRDSGLDVSYTLRAEAIAEKRQSWKNATDCPSGEKTGARPVQLRSLAGSTRASSSSISRRNRPVSVL